MLNYLGPNIGQGPVTAGLPPATPGTMPDGVPGIPSTPPPVPGIQARGLGASPAALAGITNAPPGMVPDQGPPAPPEYATTTQEDGSVLLHIKNPDGSLGPVVKLIPPIKRADSQAPPPQ